MSKDSWYYDGVKFVCGKGLMNGTGANRFSPNANTTRGMILTILARIEGVDTSGTPWYAAGQKWAMANGISDGTNMEGEITREQLAAMLYRYAKLKAMMSALLLTSPVAPTRQRSTHMRSTRCAGLSPRA